MSVQPMTSDQAVVYRSEGFKDAEVQALVDWIMQPVIAQVVAAVETGRRLQKVKATREHGTWLAVLKEMPFSEDTAQRYMRASAWFDSLPPNTAHGRYFPASYRTLAALAAIPPAEVPALIASGAIHADMTRADATALAQQYQAGRIEALNQWVGLADAITGALSRANDHERIPADIPDDYPKPDDLLIRARALVARLESLR